MVDGHLLDANVSRRSLSLAPQPPEKKVLTRLGGTIFNQQ
jgi:hypothetical protein